MMMMMEPIIVNHVLHAPVCRVNVTNAMRKRFVHLEDGELRCNEVCLCVCVCVCVVSKTLSFPSFPFSSFFFKRTSSHYIPLLFISPSRTFRGVRMPC